MTASSSYSLLSVRGSAGCSRRPSLEGSVARGGRPAPLEKDSGDTKKLGSPPELFDDVSTSLPFTSLEQLRREAAFAAGCSTSVVDAEAERVPVGEARKTLELERARVVALKEKLAILTHHCSTWGRETDRASIQVKAAAAMVEMHPSGAEHHGDELSAHYIKQHSRLMEELEVMLAERERVLELLTKATSTVAHLEERLAVAKTSFASRKAISDSNRQTYFHSLFYYEWKRT